MNVEDKLLCLTIFVNGSMKTGVRLHVCSSVCQFVLLTLSRVKFFPNFYERCIIGYYQQCLERTRRLMGFLIYFRIVKFFLINAIFFFFFGVPKVIEKLWENWSFKRIFEIKFLHYSFYHVFSRILQDDSASYKFYWKGTLKKHFYS